MRFPGILLLSSLLSLAQPPTLTRANVASTLGFDNGKPAGWFIPPIAAIDPDIKLRGASSLRITRDASSANEFTTATAAVPIDFSGTTIAWRGHIKTENVTGFAALWMRIDGDQPGIAFATLQPQKIDGTRDWKEYTISVPNSPAGKRLYFGFLLGGTGSAWVDELELLVDGKPIAAAPERVVEKTILDNDHEFDNGSNFNPSTLSATQTANLATLGKVWGFLKYHHPALTAGTRHWDYELFRILPAIAGAPDIPSAQAALLAWIDKLGPIKPCAPCVTLPANEKIYRKPDNGWIDILSPALAAKLREVHKNRTDSGTNFFVGTNAGVGNPRFEHEPSYASLKFPDPGYQLLALFRLWNIVHYFYPARDTMAPDPDQTAAYWESALTEALPRTALAPGKQQYQLELVRFISRINDTHANLWSANELIPPVGPCRLPVVVRFIENVPLVVRLIEGTTTPLQLGDRITHLDGTPVERLLSGWRPFYPASNEPTRLHRISANLSRGACGPAKISITRAGKPLTLETERTKPPGAALVAASAHDRPGPTFQKLSPDVAYLKLSSVKFADAPSYIRDAAGTKGLIIDIRNYPSEFVVFALGSLLHKEKTPFVRFTVPDVRNPGASVWGPTIDITPAQPHYEGKVVILVDEQSISQSEYTAMAFRAVPGAVVIGSTTSGADGNVSQIPLPGGLGTLISGLGVYYPDNRPTQRIGILPDITVTPTIEGIRAGRDELVEAAIRHITK